MASDILSVFCPHYDFRFGSTLTLEEAGKTEPGNPVSICDIAREQDLKQIVIIDDTIGGFIEAYKNLSKPFKPTKPRTLAEVMTSHDKWPRERAQRMVDRETAKYERESKWSVGPSQLIYGVKLTVCADHTDKSDESKKTESNVIIFIRNTAGYSDLIRIYNRAWTENHVGYGRTSWRQMKDLWTPNLTLALPFFSSCVARNLFTFNTIVPDFPVPPTLFKEVDSGLPFASLLDQALDLFARQHGLSVQPVKTIYYRDAAAFDAYVTFRAIGNRAEFARPQVDHLCSDRFSWQAYKEITS